MGVDLLGRFSTATRRGWLVVALALLSVVAMLCGTSTAAVAPARAGQLLRLVHPAHGRLNMAQSTNWFGYQQSVINRGGLSRQVGGTWTVPTATQHVRGEAEYSSAWVGVGGGCLDPTCLIGDKTLVQAGTEADIDVNGKASYYAWYEFIPQPSVRIKMPVHAGDRMKVTITSATELWTFTVRNLTRHKKWTKTSLYPSSFGTAEWIVETPLLIGTGGGLAKLPKLTRVHFDNATVNGVNADLQQSQAIELINGANSIIGVPSAPQKDGNGFGACSYATSCGVPRNY
jgi:peptidase A4-like protein